MTPDTTLADVLPVYFGSNIRIMNDKTKEHYQRSIRQFSEHLGRQATLADLTDDSVTGFLIASLETYCEVTANQRVKQIRALWNWCAKRRYVECFPTFQEAREPEPMPIAWSEPELLTLFTACSRQQGWIGPHSASTWWLSIHWWWFATAERTEATMLLERSMVDLKKQIARVPASIRKGGRKNQVYHLPDRLCELLEMMMRVESPADRVWNHPWKNWHSIYNGYRRLIDDAGLPRVRGRSGPKKLRVTVYTMMEAAGQDASKFARHSSREVSKHYLDVGELLAKKKIVWPPAGFNPEAAPARSWRTGFGLFTRPVNGIA